MIDSLRVEAKINGYSVGHIYFNYKEQEQQTPTKALASLVKQLAYQARYVPDALEKHCDELQKEQLAIQRLYISLLDISERFTKTFFIFDALDECDQVNQRRELLSLFHRICAHGPKIHMFIIGRAYSGDIQSSFKRSSKIKRWAKDDIESYVDQTISEYLRAQRLIKQGPVNYRSKIISDLLECAEGM